MLSLLLVVYSIIFVFGSVANISVIGVVMRLINDRVLSRFGAITDMVHLYYYVVGLSTANLLVLSGVPILLLEMYHAEWMFGGILCKIYWTVDNVNKVLSIFILAALSMDRSLSICRPFRYIWLRSPSGSRAVLLFCFMAAFLSMSPVLYYSGVSTEAYGFPISNQTYLVQNLTKCRMGHDMPVWFAHAFVWSLFFVAFLLPLFVILTSYIKVINTLRWRRRHEKAKISRRMEIDVDPHSSVSLLNHKISLHSQRRLQGSNRAIRSVICLIVFHFLCWTPYWISILLPLFNTNEWFMRYPALLTAQLCIHMLPYINSAANWVFYVLLNKQIRNNARKALKSEPSHV